MVRPGSEDDQRAGCPLIGMTTRQIGCERVRPSRRVAWARAARVGVPGERAGVDDEPVPNVGGQCFLTSARFVQRYIYEWAVTREAVGLRRAQHPISGA